MFNKVEKYFEFEKYNTNFKQEILAGLTTFLSMAYIIIVNPKILQIAGLPFGPSMVATIYIAFIGTILMGIYAKRPFAIAPYMGENAFIAFTVCKVLGYSWQKALGAIFISGILFTILTLTRIRKWLVEAIPSSLKISFIVGIGFFLTFIGLNECGIVQLGVKGAPVKPGDFSSLEVILAVFGFIVTIFLMMKRVKSSLLIGILSVTFLSYIIGINNFPSHIISAPPDISPIFLKLDIKGALTWDFFPIILTVFVLDFIDTMGTLIGVSYRAGFLDENGNLPDIEKPMLCDSLSTIFASLLGTTTAGVFVESATGIEVGGRTGFTAVVTAILFLSALFFAPLFYSVPPYAYGIALIIVGMLMMSAVAGLDLTDYSELVPAFTIITLMSFTYNIGIGMTAGFVIYPVIKLFQGKLNEVPKGMLALSAISLLFFIFYPYH